ncbi:MAG: hypothetical protein AB7S26_17250 [Sandaracinaceae bacterium]
MSESPTKPPGVWIVGVFAILLGCLGSCGGVFQVGNLAMQDTIMRATNDFIQRAGPQNEQQERQLELQRRAVTAQAPFKVPTMVAQGLNIIGSLALIVAAVLLFRLSPACFIVFVAACASSALADIATTVLSYLTQQATLEVFRDLTTTGDPQAEQLMRSTMRATSTVTMCMSGGWLLAKLGFYAGCLAYLRRASVRQLMV